MVGLNPVLRCLMQVEEGLERGQAVRDVLLTWIERRTLYHQEILPEERDLEAQILILLRRIEANGHDDAVWDHSDSEASLLRQSFFNTLIFGMEGHSILVRLQELRVEIEQQLELDMKAHVESLPLKMLIPLLLFMFPAFLILLLGPITSNFLEALK